MVNVKNSMLLETVIKAVYTVAGRRTSHKFADETIGSTIKTLEGKYDFLRYVNIQEKSTLGKGVLINVLPDVDNVDPTRVGKAIESIIRVVYNDLNEEAGLYFITELKQLAGGEISQGMVDREIDLDQVQVEQHYAYRRRERKKAIQKVVREGGAVKKRSEDLLGYSWNKVSKWKHEPNSKYCTLYDKEGKVLDMLNLDRIIQNYVEKLSGREEMDPKQIEQQTRIYEKEYELLKLMLERDMDAEMAINFLHISKGELVNMIRKLAKMEMLHYVDQDTIEITETGVSYLTTKKEDEK